MGNDNKKVEITKTELRALLFWASVGVDNMHGGTYEGIILRLIKKYAHIMPWTKKEYKSIEFGRRLP